MSTQHTSDEARDESIRILPDDPRYLAVVEKRFNKRFTARPDCIRQASSTEQAVTAVDEAVRGKQRLVVTSGGHCLEGFVSDPRNVFQHMPYPFGRMISRDNSPTFLLEMSKTLGESRPDQM